MKTVNIPLEDWEHYELQKVRTREELTWHDLLMSTAGTATPDEYVKYKKDKTSTFDDIQIEPAVERLPLV